MIGLAKAVIVVGFATVFSKFYIYAVHPEMSCPPLDSHSEWTWPTTPVQLWCARCSTCSPGTARLTLLKPDISNTLKTCDRARALM